MAAIAITQDLKDKNQIFKNRAIGSVYIGAIPNTFWATRRIMGGYKERTDLHETDGWREIEYPPIPNPETQKHGEIFFKPEINKFTFPIVDKTPAELEIQKQQKYEEEKQQIKENKLNKIVETNLTPAEGLKYYKEWEQRPYKIDEGAIYKGKPFRNTIEGNINAPDKGGWIEIK